jgi:hypothetical protein
MARKLNLLVLLGNGDYSDPANVVTHWLRALTWECPAEVDHVGRRHDIQVLHRAELVAAPRTITAMAAGLGYPPALARYVLRGEVSAQALFLMGPCRAAKRVPRAPGCSGVAGRRGDPFDRFIC